jgi:methionyl-tRNA formyltransferase
MDPGIDTGPVLSQRYMPVQPDDDARVLGGRLSQIGAELLLETLTAYLTGELRPKPQDDSLATYAPMLKKEDGLLDFNRPARELVCAVRAYNPWPGAFTEWHGGMLKILRSHAGPVTCSPPGRTMVHQDLPAFYTSDGLLVVDELQPAGKKPMPGQVFLRGARDWGI